MSVTDWAFWALVILTSVLVLPVVVYTLSKVIAMGVVRGREAAFKRIEQERRWRDKV